MAKLSAQVKVQAFLSGSCDLGRVAERLVLVTSYKTEVLVDFIFMVIEQSSPLILSRERSLYWYTVSGLGTSVALSSTFI